LKSFLKKNQIIIYVTALMLVAAGYMNYTFDNDRLIQTSTELEYKTGDELAGIGDATLVSSNYITTEESSKEQNNNITSNDGEENIIQEENSSNYEEVGQVKETSANVNKDDYFIKSKLERDTMYSKMIETYQNIIDSSLVSEEQRGIATQEITRINDINNGIMVCENLISTKGFSDCIVFVNGESVSIVVKNEGDLTQEEVVQIQNIISRELLTPIENINISVKEK